MVAKCGAKLHKHPIGFVADLGLTKETISKGTHTLKPRQLRGTKTRLVHCPPCQWECCRLIQDTKIQFMSKLQNLALILLAI